VKARLVFAKKEVYADGSLTEIRIWQVRKSAAFPSGVKYAFYFIGPPPEREVIIGYDNHHGKGHHRHAGKLEGPAKAVSASAVLHQFRREVADCLRKHGIELKGQP
jgi:hypothetical protein